eukprot:ctg_4334.g503
MLVRVDSGAELGAFYRRGASLEESDTDSLASISDVEARAPQGPRKVSAKSPAHDDKGTAALHGMHVICDAVQWMEGAHSPVSTGRSPSLDHARTHSVSALTLTPPHHPYPLARGRIRQTPNVVAGGAERARPPRQYRMPERASAARQHALPAPPRFVVDTVVPPS